MNDREPISSPWPDPPEGRPPVRHDRGLKLWPFVQGGLVIVFLIFVVNFMNRAPLAPADLALIEAVERHDPEAVQAAIEQGADVGRTDMIGATPLHTAAWNGDLRVARLLIEQGAEVNAADSRSGETPLHGAARGNQAEMVAFLLGRGADPGSRTHADSEQCNGRIYPAGVTALDIARQSGFSDVARRLSE